MTKPRIKRLTERDISINFGLGAHHLKPLNRAINCLVKDGINDVLEDIKTKGGFSFTSDSEIAWYSGIEISGDDMIVVPITPKALMQSLLYSLKFDDGLMCPEEAERRIVALDRFLAAISNCKQQIIKAAKLYAEEQSISTQESQTSKNTGT